MLVAALFLGVLNKIFGLHFPTWVIAFAAGVMVFVMLMSLIETSSMKNGNTALYYSATLIINIIMIIIMLTFSGIGKLIFKKQTNTEFSFGKSQKMAAVAYCIAVGSLAAIPVLANGKEQLKDAISEKNKKHLKEAIDTNNKTAFKEALEENSNLAELRLSNYNTQSLFEYLVVQDKYELVDMLIKKDKTVLTFSIDWAISSPKMIKTLIDNGMTPAVVVEKLTYKNNTALAKMVVEQYHPQFDSANNAIVEYITSNVLDHNNNPAMLDYLVEHGLAKNPLQTNEAIYYFIKKNDFTKVKMLVEKGFQIDTSQHAMMEKAISNENIEMINFLFELKFTINRPYNEYTYVEYAILSNAETVIDLLLKLKPDVTTLHPTYDEAAINALIMAEKYKQPVMLEKLKRYIAAK